MPTFYVVGSPVHYTVAERGFARSDIATVYRDIATKEIINAYPQEEKVKLFLTKEDASKYANSLQQGSVYEVALYPPIFEVEYNGPFDSQAQKDKLEYYTGINNEHLLKKIKAELSIPKDNKVHYLREPFSCDEDNLSKLYWIDNKNLLRQNCLKNLIGGVSVITVGAFLTGVGFLAKELASGNLTIGYRD